MRSSKINRKFVPHWSSYKRNNSLTEFNLEMQVLFQIVSLVIFYNEASFTQWYSETFYISKPKLFIISSHGNLMQQPSVNYLNNILACEILSMRSSFTVIPAAVFYKLCNFTSPERSLQCSDVQHCSIYRCSFQPLYYYVTSAEDFFSWQL